MIFSPKMAKLVLWGQKTETRRTVKEGKPCRYKVGRSYAVQPGRTKKAVGRIRVLDVRRSTSGR